MQPTPHGSMGLPMVSEKPGGATDPVGGMTVDPAMAAASTVHEGKHYYFCCGHCLAKFQADPGKYLAKPPAERETQAEAPAGAIYTCPMHPEIEQDHPGSCPKC